MARAAVRREILDSEAGTRIVNTLKRNGLPVYCPYSAADMATIAALDKKAQATDITVILPEKIGKCRMEKMPVAELERLFADGLEEQV